MTTKPDTATPTMEDLVGDPLAETAEAPATATTSKKKKVTKKTSAKKDVDLIVQVAHEIENMDKMTALVQGRVIQADTDFNLFKIGGILAVVRENAWYSEFETFQKYVESEFSTLSRSPYRKARYLMAIYNSLVESGVKWEQVSDLGWTKLSVIAGRLTNENVDEWIKIAKERTVIQIHEHIKVLDAKEGDPDATEPEKSDLTTFSVKVHADQRENIKQALDKSKLEFGTEYDSVALDHVMMGYLTGSLGKAKKAPSFKNLMAAMGVEEVLAVFEAVFPDVTLSAEQITVVDADEAPTEDDLEMLDGEPVSNVVEIGVGVGDGIIEADDAEDAETEIMLEEEV